MCNNLECAGYFKNQPAYQRCFCEFRKKWKSYGKVTGIIVLKNASQEECQAIGRILGKVFYDNEIRFSFSEFEQGLQKTRYAPVDMKEVLECYFEETLSTNQEQKKEAQEQKKEFFDGLYLHFLECAGADSKASLWMRSVVTLKKYGYQLLVKEYGKDKVQAEVLAKNVGNALVNLEFGYHAQTNRPLAVFAAELSGNPHYFDRGTTAGQLLIHAICCCQKMEVPKSAHKWRELLLQVGIVPDNVSSMIHAYGLRLRTADGYHPAYEAFCRLKEPYVITMENSRRITGVQATGTKVYIVENEMVFCYLLDNAKEKDITILCTSGQPRTVALELIPLILESGVKLYYSGDIDPEGIDIADRLWQKYGDSIQIWRMSPDDYEKSISSESIDEVRLVKLENIRNPLLRETAKCMKEKKVSAYQENILETMLRDILD